ncbi:MAG: hypothetical protein WAK39_22765, partial [Pseudolabrys sp.]
FRLRAERRLGELLKERTPAPPGRRSQLGSDLEPISRLIDLGIDKKLSHYAQKLADIERPEFERQVTDWRESLAASNKRVVIGLFRCRNGPCSERAIDVAVLR